MFVLINIFLRIRMTHNVVVNSLAMAYEPIIMCFGFDCGLCSFQNTLNFSNGINYCQNAFGFGYGLCPFENALVLSCGLQSC